MKKLLLLLLLLPALCFGQKNYCKKITRDVDHEKGITTYRSPELKYISALKQFNIVPIFVLTLHLTDAVEHFDAVGALIEFEDGTILNDEQVKVECKQELMEAAGAGSFTGGSNSGGYRLTAYFHVRDENMERFCTQKIVRIQLDKLNKIAQKIADKDAFLLMNYIKCLRDTKG